MARSLRTNIPAAGRVVGLVTVTAPGAQVLPWSIDQEGVVEKRFADRWNASAQKRWSEMHRRALQRVKRRTSLNSRVISSVWQLQARGVLHLHLVVRFDTPTDRRWVRAYVEELRQLSEPYYFGFIDFRDRSGKTGKPSVMIAAKAAGYLSRYLSESSQFIQATKLRDRPRRLVWVSPSITSQTFCTMRRLRRVRHLWAAQRRLCAAPKWALEDLQELMRVTNLLRLDALSQAP